MRRNGSKERVALVLLRYKATDDRRRLELLLNGWSRVVRLDGLVA